jgi:uncharacterized protein (TIRG00374 family)
MERMTFMKSGFNLFWKLFNILLGIAFLILALRGVTWGEIYTHLILVEPLWLLVAIFSLFLSLTLKIIRWVYLLRNYSVNISLKTIFGAYLIAQAVNIILPVRGGELVRVGLATAEEPASFVQTGITIGIEKLIDLVALLTLALFTVGYLPAETNNWTLKLISLTIFGSLAILILIILLGPKYWQMIKRHISGTPNRILQKGIKLVDRLVETSMWLRDYRKLTRLILLTILIWITMWSTNILLFKSLHLPMNALAGCMVLVLGYLQVLPIGTPGNIGTGYFFTELALKPFLVPIESAATYAIVLHALVTLPPLLISPLYLLVSGINIDKIKEITHAQGVIS